jgi:two-component sensor histidine kinase
LRVEDDGVGLPVGFDATQTHSLGLQLVQILTKQLDGTMQVERRDPGTCFAITFPFADGSVRHQHP